MILIGFKHKIVCYRQESNHRQCLYYIMIVISENDDDYQEEIMYLRNKLNIKFDISLYLYFSLVDEVRIDVLA